MSDREFHHFDDICEDTARRCRIFADLIDAIENRTDGWQDDPTLKVCVNALRADIQDARSEIKYGKRN